MEFLAAITVYREKGQKSSLVLDKRIFRVYITWNKHFYRGESQPSHERRMYDKVMLEILKHVAPTDLILDVGSGISIRRMQLEEAVGDVMSFDVDLDAEPFPIDNGVIKIVIHTQTLEHLYNPLFNLREVHRILRQGGTLLLVTPDDHSLMNKFQHALGVTFMSHFHQFNKTDLVRIISMAGFEVQEVKKIRQSVRGIIESHDFGGIFVRAKK